MASPHISHTKQDIITTSLSGLKAAGFGKPLIGVDPGKSATGIAISDPNWQIATPLIVLNSQKFTPFAKALIDLAHQRQIGGIIIGIALDKDHKIGRAAQRSLSLASNLKRQAGFDWPIGFWDESTSTMAMESFLIDQADLTRHKRDKVIDKLAATHILQAALDYLTRQNS